MDIREIVGAWATKLIHTDAQKKLAENRYSICNECEHNVKILGIETCNECGCPLSGKIFTRRNNSCPLGKWQEVESEFFSQIEKKTKKTII